MTVECRPRVVLEPVLLHTLALVVPVVLATRVRRRGAADPVVLVILVLLLPMYCPQAGRKMRKRKTEEDKTEQEGVADIERAVRVVLQAPYNCQRGAVALCRADPGTPRASLCRAMGPTCGCQRRADVLSCAAGPTRG